MANGEPRVFPQILTNIIAIVVTLVWATSFICDIFIPGYNPSPFIHLTMMTIVGAAVGHGFLKNATGIKNGNGNHNNDSNEGVTK